MVQVEPIVVHELAFHHLGVVHDVVGNLGISQDEGHRIVPGQLALRAVYRHTWRDLQLDPLLVDLGIRNPLKHLLDLNIRHGFEIHTPDGAFTGNGRRRWNQKASSAIVQEPLDLQPLLEHPVCHSIGLEVVGLSLIHGNQQTARMQRTT